MFTPFQPHDQFAYFSDGRYVIRRLYFTDCQREIPPKICGFLHSNTHITPIFLSRTSSYIALQAVKFSSHTYKNCVVYMEKPRWITHWPKSTRPQSETYINKNSPTEKKCQNIHDKTPKHYQHTIIFRRLFVTHTKNAHKLFEYYALIRLPTERIKKWDKNTFKTLILFGFVGFFVVGITTILPVTNARSLNEWSFRFRDDFVYVCVFFGCFMTAKTMLIII